MTFVISRSEVNGARSEQYSSYADWKRGSHTNERRERRSSGQGQRKG
jgi:hypothetical protein